MPHEAVAKAVDVVLDVLGDLDLPLTGPARLAVKGVESLRRSQEAQHRLEELLRQAEEDFRQEAQRAKLTSVAQWVESLPLHDLPTFRCAVTSLQAHWDEGALTERLAEEFARIPGIEQEEQARALALYLTCLRARLLADERFRPVLLALSTLRTEEGMERLLAAVDSLHRAVDALLGLPQDLLAWPVRLPPEQVPELRADLLRPAFRLVAYSGRAFTETLADLLAWAGGWRRRSRRWACAPTSARAAPARPAC